MKTALLILSCLTLNVSGQTINEHEKFIKANEGCKLSAYRDSRGYWTIGYGFKLPSNFPRKITQKTADMLLAREAVKALAGAKKLVPNFDSQPKNIKLVLVDLSYNLGVSGLSKFVKMLDACNDKEYGLMAVELQNSLWYDQVGDRGPRNVKIVRNCGI